MLGLAGKSLGWFLAGVAVALGFLLVPLQVAAERKKLDQTASAVIRAQRDIRSLETEFETRASLAQIDRWNAEKLQLVAPAAGQYVADEAALAAIDTRQPVGAETGAQAVAFVPSAPTYPAGAGTPAPAPAVPTRPAEPTRAETPRAALAAVSLAPRHHGQALALLDRALLDDSMIGDLRSGARAEIGSAQ